MHNIKLCNGTSRRSCHFNCVPDCTSAPLKLATSQVVLRQQRKPQLRVAVCSATQEAATHKPSAAQHKQSHADSDAIVAAGSEEPYAQTEDEQGSESRGEPSASREGGEPSEELARQLAVLEQWQLSQDAAPKLRTHKSYYVKQYRVPEQLCTGCGELKPAEEFHRARFRENGLSELCKPCQLQELGLRLQQTEVVDKNEAALQMDGLKVCFTCRETKPVSEFTSAQLALKPPRGSCQVCMRAKNRQHYNQMAFKEPAITEQPCKVCGIVKPAAEFSRRKQSKSGIGCTCKACTSSYNLQMRLMRKLQAETQAVTATQ